ncbi:MAG: dTDP-4-dehydrorhamnose 3,5-epimerase [Thermoanaerobaculia bacterium]|nr:dTDP-4-dehydrorhamnose 3,5-epimerase [Thermoanaerobaculia bacterium]
MIFHELDIPGAFLLEPERIEDRRGFFARTYCRRELEARGLDPTVVQTSVSVNRLRGTVRGMHWQTAPYEEIKLVRTTRGAIFDVILDLRPGSPTWKRHVGVELTADNRLSLYVPGGVAHGFQTQEDDTEVFYQMSEFYYPEHARGVRWDDPAFEIEWPLAISMISERDLAFPPFEG